MYVEGRLIDPERRNESSSGGDITGGSAEAVPRSPLAQALDFIGRGWSPVPVPHRKKGPVELGWPELRITADTAARYFSGAQQNIGVLLGSASGGLVDVDLDHELARRLAPYFLPPTDSVFGRKSNPDSHWLYTISDDAGRPESFRDDEGTLLEYRANGQQTVFPESTHPTGETITWTRDGARTLIERGALLSYLGLTAAATLIAKCWTRGQRDELCTAIVGAMLRHGCTEVLVDCFIVAICAVVNDNTDVEKCREKVGRLAKHLKSRDDARRVPGWPRLAEIIGHHRAGLVRRWLGPETQEVLETHEPWPDPHDFLHERTAVGLTRDDVPICIGEYSEAWARAAGFDATGVMVSCVVTAAAALHDGIYLSVEPSTAWVESARLWAAVIGAPGLAKTPMIRAGTTPLQDLHREAVEQYASARSGVAQEKDNPNDEHRDPRPALYTNDCTVEKLSEVLADNLGGVLFLAEELDSWLGSHDAYRSGGASKDRGEWLTLYDGGPHQVDRVQRGSFFVPNWGVSLLSATTPAALQKLVHRLPNDGLLQRIMPFMIARPTAPERGVDVQTSASRYKAVIGAMHGFRPYSGPVPSGGDVNAVTLHADALVALQAEILRYRDLAPACAVISEGLAGHVAKYGTMLARLVLTFHAVDCATRNDAQPPAGVPVPRSTVDLASRFLRKAFLHARAFYGMLSGNDTSLNIARRVGTALIADKRTSVSRSELVTRYKIFRDADDQERAEAMQLLVDFGWCRVVSGRYQMGYPTHWEINPAVHERFRPEGEAWLRRRALVRAAITAGAGDTE